jgi:alkyl hydroperoxide reductase subunit AhpC
MAWRFLGVLFSHPKDFTPVCTTELGYIAKLKPEFDRRNVKIIGLSVDTIARHATWAQDIRETQGFEPNYPMIDDMDLSISKAWGMLPATANGDASKRTASDNQTVRNVFVISPDEKIQVILVYPMTMGRNFDEILCATAKAALTDADGRAARAQTDATQAQKRIATLENEAASAATTRAETERSTAGVETAQEARTPRNLSPEQQARISTALRPYVGQEYTLSVGPDAEAGNLLCQIDAALQAAKWKKLPTPYSITIDSKCGSFNLSTLWGLRVRLSDKADTKHQWAMLALVNALKAEGLAVDGSIETEDASPTSIAVTAGVQP